MGRSVEQKAFELAVTVVATIGVVGLGFYLLNIRSDLAVIAGGALSLAGAVFGGARLMRVLSRNDTPSLTETGLTDTDRSKLP